MEIDLELLNNFQGKTWQEISADVQFLCRHTDFAFFTTEGFRYFLPAYLIGSVLYPEEAGSLFIHFLLFKICPPEWHAEGVEFLDELLCILTSIEKHAIRLWLEYLIEMRPEVWSSYAGLDAGQLQAAHDLWARVDNIDRSRETGKYDSSQL